MLENFASWVNFEFLSVKNGLSSNYITDIAQDKEGFLWFATADGLNKYDGVNIKTFFPDIEDTNSISNIIINCITVDSSGNIWIGTNNTIDKIIIDKNIFVHYSSVIRKTFHSNFVSINSIDFDDKNRIWIRVDNNFCLFDEEQEKITIINLDSLYNTKHILINNVYNEDSCLIFTSNTGLLYFNYSKSKYNFIEPLLESDSSYRLKHNSIFSYNNSNKYIFIGLNDKIVYLNKHNNTVKEIENIDGSHNIHLNKLDNILSDSKNNIWITTKNGLIFFDSFNEKSFKYTNDKVNPNSISTNELNCIFQDNSSVLWIGTLTNGLNKINLRTNNFTTYQYNSGNSVSGNEILGFYEDSDNKIWIATNKTGINIFDPVKKTFINLSSGPNHSDSLSGYFFSCFLEDKDSYILSGSWDGGINKIDRNTLRVVRHYLEDNNDKSRIFNSSVLCMHQDSENEELIWVGTIHGLEEFYPKETLWINHNEFFDAQNKIFDVQIWDIVEEGGYLWLATKRGLFKYKKGGTSIKWFKHVVDSNSICSDAVKCLCMSKSGYLWIGTEGGGLSRLDTLKNEFKNYRKQDGLPSNVIWGILEDNNMKLWISTNNGLSKFDTEKEKFANYFKADGLQDNKFNMLSYLKSSNGEMYFGGNNGFNVFNPDSLYSNTFSNKVVLTDLKIFNESVKIGEKRYGKTLLSKMLFKTDYIQLSYKDNVFSIEFSVLNYAFPKRIQYAYRMEGFDKKWIYTNISRRYASYTNLPAGKYSFLVKASDENGNWTVEPTALRIDIFPPFWKTWWAYTIYFIILLVIMFLLRKFVLQQERIESEIKIEKLKSKTTEEINQAKLRFYTNISHELRTPLSLVKGPVDKLIAKGKNMTWNNVQNQLKTISNNSQRLLRLVNQILDFRKVESDNYKIHLTKSDIIEFIRNISLTFNDYTDQNFNKINFHSNKDSFITSFDKDIIEKSLINLLSNAIKYGSPEYVVGVDIHIADNIEFGNIIIKVTDKGMGIGQEDVQNIFNRYYRIEREFLKSTEGTGIGLALTKKLIEIHNGRINVESKIGEGSCFIVTIPIINTQSKIEDEEIKSINYDTISIQENEEARDYSFNFDGKELLIVEDNKELRDFVKDEFQEYIIYEAENGKKGLDIAFEKISDLIISDIMMPTMNGNEMCKILKKDTRTCHIPIILLTAKSDEDHIIQGFETGADAYVVKPFSIPVLSTRIKNLIISRERLKEYFSRNIYNLNPKDILVNKLDKEFLEKIFLIVEQNISNPEFNVNFLSEYMNMSRVQLYRKMIAITGQKPLKFISTLRLNKAAILLKQNAGSVSEISYQVGYSDPAYFSRCFSKQYNVSPGNYRKEES